MKTTFNKRGISLIAVLMFMLAATTASVILFQWISQENFSSGSRLKASEAYQASQSGLEAVQGWLANKGADAGALIRALEKNNQKPVLLKSKVGTTLTVDLLKAENFRSNNSKQQDFQVYLTGVNTSRKPYEFKFLSVGTARNGSKYSQVGIFNVDGLYRIELEALQVFKRGAARKVPAYFGTAQGTQGLLESAYLTGDLGSENRTQQGYSTKGDAIVTGSMYVNSGMTIGCPVKPGYDGTHQDHLIKPTSDAYPGRSDWLANMNRLDNSGNLDPLYGNLYVKENYLSDALGVCGNAYIGGNLTVNGTIVIWGDLYVKGNLTMKQNLTVLGHLTVEGDIDMGNASYNLNVGYDKDGNLKNTSANLVMTNAASSIKIGSNGAKVRIGGIYWSKASCRNNCNVINKQNSYPDIPQPQPGADTLAYLGNQITRTKIGNPPKYTIPDPIVLGAVSEWDTKTIPAGCDARLRTGGSWVNSSGYIDFSKVGDNGRQDFMAALNSCARIGGNWISGSDSTKWLVLRVNWAHLNDFNLYVLDGNFIIMVENKPSQKMYLPLTTNNTNVLLYLKEGATNMESNDPRSQCTQAKPNPRTDACVRNYFIYSAKAIDKIDGRFFLNGNIFMKDGQGIPSLTDPVLETNERLFDALSGSGVIKDNEYKCQGTALDDGSGKCKICQSGENPRTHTCVENPNAGGDSEIIQIEGMTSRDPITDPSMSYVPAIPHLKVNLQSQYAASEYSNIAANENNYAYAEPAVLMIPRIVYAMPGDIVSKTKLAEYLSVLFLGGAYSAAGDKPANIAALRTLLASKMASNCQEIINKKNDIGIYSCTVDLKDAAKCNSDLCKNSFYVVIGTHVSSKSDGGYTNTGSGGAGSINFPGDGNSGGSSGGNQGGGATVELRCSVNNGSGSSVKKYTNLNLANPAKITATCKYSDGMEFDVTQTAYFTLVNGTDNTGTGKVNAMSICPNAGTSLFSGECTGNITVVDLICENTTKFMKAGSTINRPPTPKCLPSNSDATGITWAGYPNISDNATFKIPDNADASTEYAITASAKCGLEEDIQADCGKVKVATVTCPNTGTALAGGTIVLPDLTCTHNSSTVKAGSQSIYTAGGTGTQIVFGTADCGTTEELKNISYSCNISVISSSCTYKSADYCGNSFSNLNNVTQTSLQNAQGSAPACIFAIHIDALVNVYPENVATIEVNRVKLDGTNDGRCGIAWTRANYGIPSWNQSQKLCSEALSGVPKVDGGYYIYVNNNGNNNAGYQHFYTTGGVPDCNASESTSCDYNPAWCGGIEYKDVKDGTNAIPEKNTCLFIREFGIIQPWLNSTVTINGVPNECGCSWNGLPDGSCDYNVGCPYNTKPGTKDGGYYVYNTTKRTDGGNTGVNSWGNNGWREVVSGTKKNCTSFNYAADCAYQTSWCSGISLADVKFNTDFSASQSPQCHFVTEIYSHKPADGDKTLSFMINGQERGHCDGGCNSGEITRANGGYYIYTPASTRTFYTNWVNGPKPSGCVGGGSTPSSSSVAASSSSAKTQATTCPSANLVTYGTVPANPYTACFKYPGTKSEYHNKCYVCKVDNEGAGNTCASSWLWNSVTNVENNLALGYWYKEVICPPSGGGTYELNASYNTTGLTGEVTITCNESGHFGCYSDPPGHFTIGSNLWIQSEATSNNPTTGFYCNEGTDISLTIPDGKVIYCKKM